MTTLSVSRQTDLIPSYVCCPKSEHLTFAHFNIGLRGNVILSAAKNLSERPFVALRVTTLVCQSFVVRFREGEGLKMIRYEGIAGG
jgi:hypothetical protein